MKSAQPSKPQRYGVRNRESENCVEWSFSTGRV